MDENDKTTCPGSNTPPGVKRRGPRLATAKNHRAVVAREIRRLLASDLKPAARARLVFTGMKLLHELTEATVRERQIRDLERKYADLTAKRGA